MPGNPCPADRNDPGRVELEMEAMPCTALTDDVVPAVGVTASKEVSTPACKLCVEGFCGFAGVGAT